MQNNDLALIYVANEIRFKYHLKIVGLCVRIAHVKNIVHL